jgi:thiosulfate/3-mercaptopyruvate sulfurtransferase
MATAQESPANERNAIAPLDLGILEAADLRAAPTAWIVLDGRPAEAFREGHIPGAHSFSWEEHSRIDERGVPYQPLPHDQLASLLGSFGITETTPIVVYGDADKSWGGEGWVCWTLASIGHQGPVRLLAGGLRAWQSQSGPLEKGAAVPPSATATYMPRPRPRVDVPTSEMKAAHAFAVVDTRSNIEWMLGKIPGAVHIPWDEFHEGDDRRPIAPEQLRELLQSKGVDPSQPVVYYCAGGIRSAYAWMVHELSDLSEARNYEGGMEAWKRAD